MSVLTSHTIFQPARLVERRAWIRYLNIARVAAFLGMAGIPFSLYALFWTSPRDFPFYSSMFYVPLMAYGCVLLFSPIWRRDRFLRLLFGAGIALRLAAAGAYIWIGWHVYGQAGDAFHYATEGVWRAIRFSTMGWTAFHPPWTSTNLICNISGIISVFLGDAMPAQCVLFAFAALWGGYFSYRAFCIAFPEGNRGLYGLLIVLLPSMVYWSSTIGKDALEQLFIGISTYGFAKLVKQINAFAVIVCVIGLIGATALRPHVGALLATAMLVPFTFGRSRSSWMAISAKILLVPVLAAGTFYIFMQAQSFVGVESSDFRGNVNRLKLETTYTNIGGSTFNEGESLQRRIIQGPFLVFRPFPWEVHNAMSAFAGLEGLGLLFFAWRKRRNVLALVRQWREPFVLFILLFTFEFSLIFSAATSNFGILVRQRIMMVPIFLMLFCAKFPEKQVLLTPLRRRRNVWLPKEQSIPQLNRSVS